MHYLAKLLVTFNVCVCVWVRKRSEQKKKIGETRKVPTESLRNSSIAFIKMRLKAEFKNFFMSNLTIDLTEAF